MSKKIFFIFISFNIITFHTSMFGMNITDGVSNECTTSTGYIYTQKNDQWMFLSFTGVWNKSTKDSKYFSNLKSEGTLDLTIKNSIFLLKKSDTTHSIKFLPEDSTYTETMRRKLLRFDFTKKLFICLEYNNEQPTHHYIRITKIIKPKKQDISPTVKLYCKGDRTTEKMSILGEWKVIYSSTKKIDIPDTINSCTLHFSSDPTSLTAQLPGNITINIELDSSEMKKSLFTVFNTRNSEKFLRVKINKEYYQILNPNNTIKETPPSIPTETINNQIPIFECQGFPTDTILHDYTNIRLDDNGKWVKEKNNESFSYDATKCSLKITNSNSLKIQTPTKNITLNTLPTEQQLSALSQLNADEWSPLFMLVSEDIGKNTEEKTLYKDHYFYVTEIIKSSQLTVDTTETDSESETKEPKKDIPQIERPKPDTKSDNKNLAFGYTIFQIGLATTASLVVVIIALAHWKYPEIYSHLITPTLKKGIAALMQQPIKAMFYRLGISGG